MTVITFRQVSAWALFLALVASASPHSAFAVEGIQECPEGQEYSVEADACIPVQVIEDIDGDSGEFCTIVSDPITLESGDAAVVLTDISEYWTALISGAYWIWDQAAPNDTETVVKTFTRTFTLSGIPTDAEFQIAADDGYAATLNGTAFGADNGMDEVNFTTEGQDTFSVSSGLFVEGENTLVVEATNIAWSEATSNPGGILFRLKVEGASCDDDGNEGDDLGTLIIEKKVEGVGEGVFNFTFTIDPEEGDSFPVVVETNGSFGSHEEELPEGWYTVSEIVPEGWTFGSLVCEDGDSFETAEADVAESETVHLDEGESLTCTFTNIKEVVEEAPPKKKNDGNTGGRVRSPGNTGGSVLGATTECTPLITEFLGKGYGNSSEEVMKLQNFLNDELGLSIPVTGTFGPTTEAAVHVFQKKYWDEVLKPWFEFPDFGIKGADDSTGIVYKTTKWKINDIFCPGSEALPALP